jgi:lysophosphatidylcholine acyltransferase/lyso-PAF acetyltransferase
VREIAERSPFVDLKHPVDVYEAVKMIVMAPVALLRLVLAFVSVVVAWCLLHVLMVGHDVAEPMAPWRYRMVAMLIGIGSRILMFIVGFYYIEVKGRENLEKAKKEHSILVFNHVSYTDPVLLLTQYQACGVSKAGVAEIPFIGKFPIALQFMFIARKGSADKMNKYTVKMDAQQAVLDRCWRKEYPLLAMAPEATTKPGECLLKFRKGAFVPGRAVSPVLFKYDCKHFHVGWGAVHTGFHVWRLLSQFVNKVSIEFLAPYFPSEEEKKDPVLYAANVRKLMGEKLGIPTIEKGLEEEHMFNSLGIRVDIWGRRVVYGTKDSLNSDSVILHEKKYG